MRGGHDDEDDDRRPPPAPDDRLWRHPSEVAMPRVVPIPPQAATAERDLRHRGGLAVTLIAGATGALLTLGVLFVSGSLGSDHTAGAPPAMSALTTSTARLAGTGSGVDPLLGSLVSITLAAGDPATEQTRVVSALVFDERGHAIVTDRAIGRNAPMAATCGDARTEDVRVVARDEATGITVVRLGDGPWPIATAAEPSRLTGTVALVVNALRPRLNSTEDLWMSRGTINATNRSVEVGPEHTVHGLLQVDAPVPGPGAGVLAEPGGRPLGVLVSVDDDPTDGLAYALPMPAALAAARDLITHGHVQRPWIGVDGTAATRAGKPGVELTAVHPASPAAAAGLRVGDLLVSVDGEGVERMADLAPLIGTAEVGHPLSLVILRGGERRSLPVIPAERPRGTSSRSVTATTVPTEQAIGVSAPG